MKSSEVDRVIGRLADILQAIEDINLLVEGKTLNDLEADRFVRAAFERFIEIISEASRHVPLEMKNSRPEVPWRQIADIGNHLRHAYTSISAAVLWDIYEKQQFVTLREAVASIAGEMGSGLR